MNRFVETYTGEEFDLVVVGGGITGTAVAYEAATKGFRVALVEKKDFGWATSAASSKMIHGGLRYLAYREFGLVRESLRERRILENIAPNFVYPFPLLVPSYGGGREGKWALKAGLTLYDLMAFDKKWTWDKSKEIPGHHALSREESLKASPFLRQEGLTGASVYYDCQNMFPERMTLAFLKSAIQYGAVVSNYTEAADLIISGDGKMQGLTVTDLLSQRRVDLKSSLIINCGGPWADNILGLSGKGSDFAIRRSEGIHIITRKFRSDYGVVLRTPAGRHFFVLPWRNHSLIGTTDKEFFGSPDTYHVTRESIAELIKEVNESYGDGGLTYQDIKYAYGGLRPLVETQTEETYESSRKYEIFDNAETGREGLITVEGGKYTTSRNLAVNVLKMVENKLCRPDTESVTDKKHLFGCEIQDMGAYLDFLGKKYVHFDQRTVEYLGRNYGTESRHIFEIASENPSWMKPVTEDGEILAEVVYAVRHEMARTLSDIMLRRTGLGTLGYPGDELTSSVARIAARLLGWSDEKTDAEIELFKNTTMLPQ